MKFSTVMVELLQHGRELIQKEPLKSSQIEFYAAELLPKLSESEILAAVKHHSLDNHWPSVNEILAFNQKASSSDKAKIESLASRAIALLRYPQRDGYEQAQKADPEAFSLLLKAGRWYDLHVRSEDPRNLRDLKFELKTIAENALKTGQTNALSLLESFDKEIIQIEGKTQPQAQTEVFQPDPDIKQKILALQLRNELERPPVQPVKLPPDMDALFQKMFKQAQK